MFTINRKKTAVIVGGAPLTMEDRRKICSVSTVIAVNHHFIRQQMKPNILFANGSEAVMQPLATWMQCTGYYVPLLVVKATTQSMEVSDFLEQNHKAVETIWWDLDRDDWVRRCDYDTLSFGGTPFTGVYAIYYALSLMSFKEIYVCGFNLYQRGVENKTVAERHGIEANAIVLWKLKKDNARLKYSNELLDVVRQYREGYKLDVQ